MSFKIFFIKEITKNNSFSINIRELILNSGWINGGIIYTSLVIKNSSWRYFMLSNSYNMSFLDYLFLDYS